MPSMPVTCRRLTAFSIVAIDVNNAKVMTGSITFNCNWPADRQCDGGLTHAGSRLDL